jgi:hypothetical protein
LFLRSSAFIRGRDVKTTCTATMSLPAADIFGEPTAVVAIPVFKH